LVKEKEGKKRGREDENEVVRLIIKFLPKYNQSACLPGGRKVERQRVKGWEERISLAINNARRPDRERASSEGYDSSALDNKCMVAAGLQIHIYIYIQEIGQEEGEWRIAMWEVVERGCIHLRVRGRGLVRRRGRRMRMRMRRVSLRMGEELQEGRAVRRAVFAM
jgi:hypothetical protein